MSERFGRTPERKKYATHEIIQFNDRMTALSFTREYGAVVENKWVGSGNPMILRTESTTPESEQSEFIGYGMGVMMTVLLGPHGEQLTLESDFPIILGEPCQITGRDPSGREAVITTGVVTGVLAQYKMVMAQDHFTGMDHFVDKPSPFRALRADILRAENRLGINRRY